MSKRARLSLEVRAGRLRALGVADRVRRRFHRASYWRGLSARHPLNGATRSELEQLVARELERVHDESSLVPLPGLEIRGGRCFYGGHALERVEPELANLFQVLRNGGLPSESEALIKAGLAVETRVAPDTAPERALIVSPHRDDGSLSLGGLMVARADQEAHWVCNVFTVSAWLGEGFHGSTMRDVSRLRASEELLSLQVLGANGVGLGLWEADIRNYHRKSTENYTPREDYVFEGDPSLRNLGERDSVQRGVAQLIDRLSPTRVYFPLGLGSHIDHMFLRDFGRARATSIQNSRCQVYFYEDLPYATYEHVDVAGAVTKEEMGGLALVPEFVDISEHVEAKIQAIAAHRSQFHRSENEERLRIYAAGIAAEAGFPEGQLAERVWRVDSPS